MSATIRPKFFDSGIHFRRWLASNHASAAELWVGFWKVKSGKKGLTYEEAVEEALCFGWIDGLVKGYDEHSYMQRFTPRRATSIWSAMNIAKVEKLTREGRMAPPGIAAFEARDPARAGLYSFENRHITFDAAFESRFRAKSKAWKFFDAQPPGYKRLAAFWVMSAKREETRERRFTTLVEDSGKGVRVASLAGKPAATKPKKRKGR
jgi:uncharacterized protein YdeI (YjbR/CyaY-like superfamily)